MLRRRTRTQTGWLLSGGCLVAVGCSEPAPPDPAPVVWSGSRVEVATHGTVLECAGSRAYLDAFAERVIDELGIESGEGQRARIYLLEPDELDALGFCPPDARCVYADRVYTDLAVDKHELVHALRGLEYGNSLPGPIFFEEGLATLYEDDDVGTPEDRDVLLGLESGSQGLRGRLELWWYGLAAEFVAFLSRDESMQSVARFLDSAAGAETLVDLERVFEEHFDGSLEAAAERYDEETPRCTPFGRTRHIVECEEEPLPIPAEVSFDLSCAAEGVVGPMDGTIWRSFTFEVEDDALLLLRTPLEGESPFMQPRCSGFTMQVTDCDRGCVSEIDIAEPREGEDEVEEALNFSPGRYVVRLSRPVDDPGEACVEIGPLVPE